MDTMEQGLILANREHIQSKPHQVPNSLRKSCITRAIALSRSNVALRPLQTQLVTCALFCIVGSSVYVVYMIMNRLVQLALASIESRPYHADGIAQYTEEVSHSFSKCYTP